MSDLISRSALKDRFKLRIDWLEKDKHDDYTTGVWDGCLYDADLIEAATAVDAVPVVHGRWVLEEMTFDVGGDPMFPCSECKTLSYAHADGRMYNYCPNCGADMRERKEK